MSEKLEKWKGLTTTQVRLTGCISAATGLEMMEYISHLEKALEKYRGQINQHGKETASDDLSWST